MLPLWTLANPTGTVSQISRFFPEKPYRLHRPFSFTWLSRSACFIFSTFYMVSLISFTVCCLHFNANIGTTDSALSIYTAIYFLQHLWNISTAVFSIFSYTITIVVGYYWRNCCHRLRTYGAWEVPRSKLLARKSVGFYKDLFDVI